MVKVCPAPVVEVFLGFGRASLKGWRWKVMKETGFGGSRSLDYVLKISFLVTGDVP